MCAYTLRSTATAEISHGELGLDPVLLLKLAYFACDISLSLPMGRRRKVILKPAVVSDESTVEVLPSNFEVESETINVEEFHEPCAELEIDRGVEEVDEGCSIRSSSRAVNWAEEVEGNDFQNSAKEVWSKFKSNQVLTPSTRLDFTKPMKVGDQVVARLDLEEVEVEASFWRNAIVCIVLGANPPFRVFEGFVKRIWGNLGVDKIVRMHSGFTLVNLRDEATRDLILETGVIHFDRKPVVLRPWTTDLDSVRMVKSVPVWIRLNGLGLQYWGKNSLSALVVNGSESDNQQVPGAARPENSEPFIAVPDTEGRDETLSKGIESKESNNEQSSHSSSQLGGTSRTDIVGTWSTPKRRGSKQVVATHHKAVVAPSKANVSNGWNVRGMNKKDKQKAILDVCKENKVGFGAFFETKVKHEKIQEVFGNNCHNWDYFSSSIISGRILIIWHAKFVKVDILFEDPQLVHCRVKVSGQKDMFLATVVYGSNSMLDRKSLWDKLANIGHPNYPWIIFGDFNAMFSFQDRNGGRHILAKDIVDAQDWVALGQVEEFQCFEAHFTWSNKHDIGDRIFSKLDREINKVGIKPFRFCNHWLQYSRFKEAVLGSWNTTSGSAGGLNQLVKKLLRVKHVLKRFNREEVGNVVLDYKLAKEELSIVQEAISTNPSDHSMQLAVSQAQQYFSIMQKRYSCFLKHPSKINWVVFSDENSKYFHAVMRKRRLENRITSFITGDKTEDDYEKVVNHFLSHFEQFMGRSSSATMDLDLDCMNQGNSLSVEQQVRLLRPFSKRDVKKAMFSIHSSKSPGLDGFGSGFFKGLWGIIGAKISQAVLGFFQDGFLPKSLNETVISLIPKVADPKSASDYRPIACCNTLYKCISKLLCTRLSEVLPFLVHSNQGAFIKNRNLAHNIMIFQDLLKGYTRKNISARCIMKIDLSKAYDTVDWLFVEKLLKSLCFPSRFINWIMVCLKGTSYSLLMNGRIQGSFKGEKGLRQGDPISPLLFVLIMEYLTRLLAHNAGKKGFGFHPLCKHLRLTNLCFADDLIIFCKGLSASKTKSNVFFGGVKDEAKLKILDLMQMDEGTFPLKYLGVHLRPTKWKAADCGVILDKLHKNLNCWASRNLSFAGRAQLIHSVLIGIRNFWMGIFILPSKVTAAIDKCCRDFLWGSRGNRSKLHLPSWEKVCLPKKLGGIGFREGKKWNMALMAKYIWASSSKQDCLWVKWINSIYLKDHTIWSIPIKQDMSWYFKKLLKLRQSTDYNSLKLAEKGATLYFIWKNRNNCIFELACYSSRSVSFDIRKVVKCRILGLGLLRSSKMDSYLINVVEGW
ncbi:uncharacterized protein LOC133779952 [Humulus lupulus]|uniref:uncharacterized protein LOC133779952 n=1 Tax=Humulus lupulus TaxID=3486 RepID=UPI002B41099E|nr:uncharacterized protein LOC133779952 [Humulus lupulus]